MPKMIATKAMRYATRRLRAGDEFTVIGRDARLLEAIGHATIAPADDKPTPRLDIATLREHYRHKFGKRPFMGWTAEQLAEKLRD